MKPETKLAALRSELAYYQEKEREARHGVDSVMRDILDVRRGEYINQRANERVLRRGM